MFIKISFAQFGHLHHGYENHNIEFIILFVKII